MNKDIHVYCLDCIHYEDMYNKFINEDHEHSVICSQCYPWYPEDSRSFELRKNYMEATRKTS